MLPTAIVFHLLLLDQHVKLLSDRGRVVHAFTRRYIFERRLGKHFVSYGSLLDGMFYSPVSNKFDFVDSRWSTSLASLTVGRRYSIASELERMICRFVKGLFVVAISAAAIVVGVF